MNIQRIVNKVLLCGLLTPGFSMAEQRWYFELGPAYRGGMEISVRGGTHVPPWRGTEHATARRSPRPSSLLDDDGTEQQLRTFEDGFVGPSGWEHALNDGRTQYWGYDASSQYDASSETLSFRRTLTDQRTQTRRVTRLLDESAGWSNRKSMEGAGLMLAVGRRLRERERWACSVHARLGWLDGLRGNFRQQTAYRRTLESQTHEQTQLHSQTYRYAYDTLGNPAFPTAPYTMSDPTAAGPMIADTPSDIVLDSEHIATREQRRGQRVWTDHSTVDLAFDAQVFTLQLGSRFTWQARRALSLLAQPAITLNVLDAETRRDEAFRSVQGDVLGNWTDHTDAQRWRVGAGAQLGARLDLWKDWGMTVVGGYGWVDNASFDVGPDRVRIDLSGYHAEVLFGRVF